MIIIIGLFLVLIGIDYFIIKQIQHIAESVKEPSQEGTLKVTIVHLGDKFMWTIYQDGKAFKTGTAENLELALADAYGAVAINQGGDIRIFG